MTVTPFVRHAAIFLALLAVTGPTVLDARSAPRGAQDQATPSRAALDQPTPSRAAQSRVAQSRIAQSRIAQSRVAQARAPRAPRAQAAPQGQPVPPAQPPAPGTRGGSAPTPGPAVPSENLTPGELNRLFEAYAVLQAQNMLKLTDEQYADFIIRLRALQRVRRRHQQAHNRLVQDLRKLTNPLNTTADEASIKAALDALTQADATAHGEIRQATAQVDELLDTRQQARFRVFEENLERWKLDLLSRVRRPNRDKPRPPKS